MKTANIAKPQSTKQPSKRIDLGAASTYGKNEFGINSPTHRNTHSEDLFSVDNNNTSTTSNNVAPKQATNLVDDLLETNNTKTSPDLDDFNPRAEEAQEFGDFETAFGKTGNKTAAVPTKNGGKNVDEFADFTSAFTGKQGSQQSAPAPKQTSDLLFGNIGSPDPIVAGLQPDLFSSISSTVTGQTPQHSNTTADLLSDFGNLQLGPQINGTYNFFHLILQF